MVGDVVATAGASGLGGGDEPTTPSPTTGALGWLGKIFAAVALIGSVASIWSIALLRQNLSEPEWGLRLVDVMLFTTAAALACLVLQQFRHQARLEANYESFRDERRQLIEDHNRAIIAVAERHTAALSEQARAARTSKAAKAIHDVLHEIRQVHVTVEECRDWDRRKDEVQALVGRGADTEKTAREIIELVRVPPELRDVWDLYAALRRVLSKIVDVFELTTGESVRACVKLLGVNGDTSSVDPTDETKFLVWTLCRHDEAAEVKNREAVPLYRNSDFRTIFDKESPKWWFVSNDLDAEPGYQNPHRPPGQAAELHEYNATMVWGIQHRVDTAQGPRVDLLGFLCVDSKVKHAFDPDIDFQLGAAFADSLYAVLAYSGLGGPDHRYEKGSRRI